MGNISLIVRESRSLPVKIRKTFHKVGYFLVYWVPKAIVALAPGSPGVLSFSSSL